MDRERINLAEVERPIPAITSRFAVWATVISGIGFSLIGASFGLWSGSMQAMTYPVILAIALGVIVTLVVIASRNMTQVIISQEGVTYHCLMMDYYFLWEDVEWAESDPLYWSHHPLIKFNNLPPKSIHLDRSLLLRVMSELSRRGKNVNHFRWHEAKTFRNTNSIDLIRVVVGFIMAIILFTSVTYAFGGDVTVSIAIVSSVFFFVFLIHAFDRVTISPVALVHHLDSQRIVEDIESVTVQKKRSRKMLVKVSNAGLSPKMWISSDAADELRRNLRPEQWVDVSGEIT